MKKILFSLATICFLTAAKAQVFYTKTGSVSFFSHTSVQDIKADNYEAVSFLDATKGELRFQLLIKGFQFEKTAMQEHFNGKDYMDSDQFPKSDFKGTITNLKAINFKKDGTYKAEVEGDLTMHGVTKKIKQTGTITIKDGKPSVTAVFKINRTDFGVKAPAFAAAKIAEELELTVKASYEPYNK